MIMRGDTISVHRPDREGHIMITHTGLDNPVYLTRESVIDLMALLHTALTMPDKVSEY